MSAATTPPPPHATTGTEGTAPVQGDGAPGSGPGGGPEAPAAEACPLCGAPLAPDQEWCLHCGAAARTRLATSSNWKGPIIAVAVVVVLSLGVLAASLVSLAGKSGSATVIRRTVTTALAGTPTTTTPAPEPGATGTTTPGATGATTPGATTPGATTPPATSAPASTSSPGTASGPLATKPTVTPPSGPPPTTVQFKDLVTGTGAVAKAPETVTVNYVGVLYAGGAEFDSSWRRGQRFTFTLGTNQVISGWNEGVSGMRVGGRRELIVPASFAYGATGLATKPVGIPPNAALVFVVDLLKA